MLAKVTVFLFFLLLIWGNAVAGLGVGLACPDWPLCHGKLIPPIQFDIYMEWMHRNIGAVASIFLIVLSYYRLRDYKGLARLIPPFTVFLLIFQIVLGGVVVLLKLPVDLTTVHFANALLIFSLVFYMAFFDGKKNSPLFSVSGYGGLFFLLAVLVFMQAVLGAYVRHSDAGLACPDFPKCLGFWVPPELSGTVLTHFSHRALAYVILAVVLLLYIFSYMHSALEKNRSKILILLCLVIIQIVLGVGVIHSKLHFSTTAFHLGTALLILSVSLYSWFQGMRVSHV
jgi:cytochrome c oxidase assembly protein subunit 15